MTQEVELNVTKGANLFYTITLTDDSNNTKINITDYVFNALIKRDFYSSNSINYFNITKTDSSNGELIIKLTSDQTNNIGPGRFAFTIMGTDELQTTQPYLRGLLIVDPS